ncbi:glycosyltransferase family 25 protein [Sessilibacter corallicola]|uniref:Glycosyl transferase family 25 domain-containing protein n=1 Tax=Sessilibacter corallicola TaxID=2904075 RepID=A0ABQ0A5G9_9GAMM
MSINAWIISLEPYTEEAKTLQAYLRDEGLNAAIKTGVDGRQGMPKTKSGETLSQTQSLVNRRVELTPSEVGCYLSHYRLVKEAYEQGLEHICIFESDVLPEDDLGNVIKSVVSMETKFHFVRLMNLKMRRRKAIKAISDKHTITRLVRGGLGTQGYIVNREGMRRILKKGAEISLPIDGFYDSFFLMGLNCYCVEPHVIYEVGEHSTIKKSSAKKVDQRFSIRLAWYFTKIYKSLLRRHDFIVNVAEYFPAKKQTKDIGRSFRMR